MLDHPQKLSKKLISSLFNRAESDLNDFDFNPVGSGQVGDCYILQGRHADAFEHRAGNGRSFNVVGCNLGCLRKSI